MISEYRAYHSGKMWKPFDLEWFKDDAVVPDNWDDTGILDGGKWPADTIFLQNTGLKDEKDVEIFEGDIIDAHRNSSFLRTVEWNGEFAQFIAPFSDGSGIQLFSQRQCSQCKIVGNIHDNPELLDAK